MSGFCGLPVPSFFMTSGTRHVLDGYEPPRARAFDRGEVYRPTSPLYVWRRLWPSAPLLRLPSDLSGLIGDLPSSVLHLLCCLACGVLGLTRYLSGLVGGLACNLLGLSSSLPRGVLHALPVCLLPDL